MESQIVELTLNKSTNLSSCLLSSSIKVEAEFSDSLGGILKNGSLGWIANGPNLSVFSLKNHNKVASYTFKHHLNTQPSLITCVTEIEIPECKTCILAVGVQFDPIGGMICIFSVLGSRVLESIEIMDKIICCTFIPQKICDKSCMKYFDGSLVYGTDTGKVYLVDLFLKKCNEVLHGSLKLRNDIDLTPTFNMFADVDPHELKSNAKRCRMENVHCTVQLEVLEDSGPVLSMLVIPPQTTLVIGLYDGRMILYDLLDLQAYHLAYPPEMNSPLVKICYIEPADDPRACLYVWALHYNNKSSIGVMHSIVFESKIIDEHNYIYYKDFQSCSVRLTIPFMDPESRPLSCQSITKYTTFDEEEEIISICILSWESVEKSKTNLLVFDLNQWYKEQMPEVLSIKSFSSCLALLSINSIKGLDVWVDTNSLTSFKSIQRPEEHFYPTALSFNCIYLAPTSYLNLSRVGLQNQALVLMNSKKSKCVLDPSDCYNILINAALFPQSWDDIVYSKIKPSINIQREYILSVALEYHCISLLKECSKLWADGSYLGNDSTIEGLSLSTLTDWLWKRAQCVKDVCNQLCVPLFDQSQIRIDNRTSKKLAHCTKQLKILAYLLETIINMNRSYIPEDIQDKLTLQYESLKTSYEYQELLQWLLNTGILPEGVFTTYPYDGLNEFYSTQRFKFQHFHEYNANYCPYLYIDKFMEVECNLDSFKLHWKETNGIYPPISLQEMLRIMLIPKLSKDVKYTLVLYLLLDLSVALENGHHQRIINNLIKFPVVFMIKPALIKKTQAFWKLDHGQYESALDDLFSPLSGSKPILSWQLNFLTETLLVQELPQLALRCIRACDTPIKPELHIKILLSNNCIGEAFQVQRTKGDPILLREFFKLISIKRKWKYLLDFALTTTESKILCDFLYEINTSLSENFYVIYLLQRSKYIEAINLLDKIQRRNNFQNIDADNSNLILTSYNFTMNPVVKNLTNSYLTEDKNKNTNDSMNNSEAYPFSKCLIENKTGSNNSFYKTTLDYIKSQQISENKMLNKSISEPIPLLGELFYEKSSHYDKESQLKYPKLLNKTDVSKRKLNLDYSEHKLQKEFEKPRKRHLIESEFKNKLLTHFRERKKGYDFSSTKINFTVTSAKNKDKDSPKLLKTPLIERNYDRITGSPSRGILKTAESPCPKRASAERSIKFDFSKKNFNKDDVFLFGREKRVRNVVKVNDALVNLNKSSEEKFFGLEEKVTAEIWNADESITSPKITSKRKYDDSMTKTSPHPLEVQEKMTAEIWNKPVVNSTMFINESTVESISKKPKRRHGLRSRSRSNTPDRVLRSSSITPDLQEDTEKSKIFPDKNIIESIYEIPDILEESIEIKGNNESEMLNDTINLTSASPLIIEPRPRVLIDDSHFYVNEKINESNRHEDEDEHFVFTQKKLFVDSYEEKVYTDAEKMEFNQVPSDELEPKNIKENSESCKSLVVKEFNDNEIVRQDSDDGGIEMNYGDDMEKFTEVEDDNAKVFEDLIYEKNENLNLYEEDFNDKFDSDTNDYNEEDDNDEEDYESDDNDQEDDNIEIIDISSSDEMNKNSINDSDVTERKNQSDDDEDDNNKEEIENHFTLIVKDDENDAEMVKNKESGLNNALIIDETTMGNTMLFSTGDALNEAIIECTKNASEESVVINPDVEVNSETDMKVFDEELIESNIFENGFIENDTAEEEKKEDESFIVEHEISTERKIYLLHTNRGRSTSVDSEAISCHETVEKKTYSLRNVRARSVSIDSEISNQPVKRSTRASSVPKQESDVTAKRILRSSSTDHAPKKLLSIKSDLENIEENELLTPTCTHSYNISLTQNTPRRRSISKSKENLVEPNLTPKTKARRLRSSSIEIENQETNDSPAKNLRKKIEKKSLESNKFSPTLNQHENLIQNIAADRRLTRHQLAVLEKMEEKQISPVKYKKRPESSKSKKSENTEEVSEAESDISETGSEISVKSKKSNSSRKSTRSNRSKKGDDTEKNTKDQGQLTIIREEPELEDSKLENAQERVSGGRVLRKKK